MTAISPQLLVVMPVFNESESIARVIREWFPVLDKTAGYFILLVIDDGSTDDTADILDSLKSEWGERLEVLSRPNRGHGQTCLQGYRISLERGIPFILQIDSDGQSIPRHFQEFWDLRDRFEVIYGNRSRKDGFRRVLASAVLRSLLRILVGVDCEDANVPYRLMNSQACGKAIASVPSDFFLANIALAVALKKNPSIRHGMVPIGFPPRIGGEPSVPFSKFAAKALELFSQLKRSGLGG